MKISFLVRCLAPICLSLGNASPAAGEDSHELVHGVSTKKYCTPYSSPPCWPSYAAWSSFNTTVNGNLIEVIPWAYPCFTNPGPFNIVECEKVKLQYTNSFTRSDQVGTAEYDNWAYCYTNEGEVGDCSIDASNLQGQLNILPEPPSRKCRLGRISPYAVAVSSPQEIQATIAFAKRHNIKLVIKNTGHDYVGRSTAPHSLMIWAHNLQSLQYNEAFTPVGGTQPVPAIIMGAGVQADKAYRLAAANGKDITLGAYNSVGGAGGYGQGGGHGPLAPTYGLAVDNIVQYSLVTADEKIVTANAYTNSDLYFALRGGGGGTWGVVTEAVYKVHDSLPITVFVFELEVNRLFSYSKKLEVLADFTENLAAYEVGWRKKGWGGYAFAFTDSVTFGHFQPGGTVAEATEDMAGFMTYLKQRQLEGQWVVVVNFITQFPNFEACRKLIIEPEYSRTPYSPVGLGLRYSGRLISIDQYSTPESRKALGKAVANAYREVYSSEGLSEADIKHRIDNGVHIFSTGPPPARFGGPTGEDTGVNTAWRDSIWEVGFEGGWRQGISQSGRNTIARRTSRGLDFLRPMGTGAYFNEADVLEPDWQTAFFGGHYERLVEIKRKWDKDNVFLVFKGIGYEGQELQAPFDCYEQA